MLMTVEELRRHITTNETDDVLKDKLHALELMIRAHTSNNFMVRSCRIRASVRDGVFQSESAVPFAAGDTVQISQSAYSDALLTVDAVDGDTFSAIESVPDEESVFVTKVQYPADVKLGVINIIKWDMKNREKVGIQSETVSRHSVTYGDTVSGASSEKGYPKSLMDFLQPYMCARFGRGDRA